jgi:hypothetical protein
MEAREQMMIDLKSQWSSVSDRGKWAARGSSFVAKAKATKAVWLPPKPVESGKKKATKATKATGGAARKTTRKTTGAAKKATKRTAAKSKAS